MGREGQHPPYLAEEVSLRVRLRSIVAKQFSCLENLQYLCLSSNFISNIENFAFQELSQLESLLLDKNQIKVVHLNTFYGLHKLTMLDLSENVLIKIETCSFASLLSLRAVWLGDLNYPSASTEPVVKMNLTDTFGNVLSQLNLLSISSGMRPVLLTIGSNVTSSQNLSLHLKGKKVSFEDCERPFFKSVIHLHVDTEQFLCGATFMGRFFRSVETFAYISKLSAKSVDMTELNQLVHLRRLTLTEMDLSNEAYVSQMFHNLTKLEVLGLRNCRINTLDGTLTKDLQALKMLSIHIADVYDIFQSFVEPLSGLRFLQVNHFNVFCDCDNVWFLDWPQRRKQVLLLLVHEIMNNLTCLSDNGMDHLNFSTFSRKKCRQDVGYVLFLVTGPGVLCFLSVALLCNFCSPYVLPLYHITLGWLAEAVRADGGRRYRYDAFVSYSGKDERWVVEELLPNLERRGPPFLRLCLHGRDFQVGKDVVENITDSLYQSRHTLCLVSRRFLRSRWCSLEMQLATCRLKAERRDVLVLVFLERVSPRQLSAHHRLARLVKSRTYLDWPQEPKQQGAFWDRLWDKLKPQAEV
ncbi:toll-like receptor 13 [Aplochiton taeniatus]